MDKGAELNQRVWKLFEKAGFRTKPNSASPAEFVVTLPPKKARPVDLHATEPDLGVTIVGSNKSGAINGWSAHLNDFRKIADTAQADAALLVVTAYEPDDDDKAEAAAKNISVWGPEQLEYFEAVAEAIREYAKYEIIHTLGITTKEEKDTHRVLAIQIEQPIKDSPAELFMFSTSPERLLKTCVIYRRAVGSAQAYQRMLRRNRLTKIRAFVSTATAVLPTNIVVHLGDKVSVDPIKPHEFKNAAGQAITLSKTDFQLVSLNIPMEYASLEILDGQHRLFGFANTDAATKKKFNLVVLGIRGLTPKKRRETFVAINDNSRRMDPNLVAYLKYTKDDAECQKSNELMAIRVAVDLNSATPFKGSIRLLDIGKQKLTLKGFSGYDLKGLLGSKGALRKFYPSNTPAEYVSVLNRCNRRSMLLLVQ